MFAAPSGYVALDLETTGLDPGRDRITEIGAVRFDGEGRELAVFDRLVNPGRPIPLQISQITGITDADVRGEPPFEALADELAAFVGESAFVGQNAAFDLTFLAEAGLEFGGPVLDTLRLARILFPEGPGALGDLAAELGIEMPVAHRALADARATASVFLALRRRAEALPPGERASLARIVALEDPALARELGGEALDAEAAFEAPALPEAWRAPEPLERAEVPRPVTAEEARAALAGAARVLERFEERPQQAQMAEAVAEAFADGGHWLIEAGTGVGKSLAYLIPAALHALRNGERVVISTNTIALQEQLLGKDVPALREILREAGAIAEPEELRVTQLKGRANYLCARRWASQQASLDEPEIARLAATLTRWVPHTETGDRSELRLGRDAFGAWPRVCAADTDCLSAKPRPSFVRDGRCFLQRARQRAASAHLVIVNHSLLLADVTKGSVLPSYDRLIIDEAQNLDGVATQQFGMQVGPSAVQAALDAIYRPPAPNRRASGIAARTGFLIALDEATSDDLIDAVTAAGERVAAPFTALQALRGDEYRLRITSAVRSGDEWGAVETGWAALDGALKRVIQRGAGAVPLLREQGRTDEADEMDIALRQLRDLVGELEALVGSSGQETILWVSGNRDGTSALNSAPLEVAPLLESALFNPRTDEEGAAKPLRTIVATSATLMAGGSMAFTAEQMGLAEAATLELGSPFDYERTTLLATPAAFPEPNRPGYDAAAADAITKLALASEGRALALFTSHASLQRVAEMARGALERAGISVLVQGRDGSPRQLTNHLREHSRAIIFGTTSFWEGIDIRGEALSLVVIARLPFPVPTDPIHETRSETYDDPFRDYSLPLAILRFRQGFGRLIRDREDRGVVAVLDTRVRTRRYGAEFLDAIPVCTRLSADVGTIAARTREWLAQ